MADAGRQAAALSSDRRLGPARLDQSGVEAWGGAIGVGAGGGRIALPLVLALRGDLGVGKSVLARAVARGVGVVSPMPSPTFNLVFSYTAPADIAIHHVDLYRLEAADEIWELGWQELGVGRQVVLIEWPERAEEYLPADRWDVRVKQASPSERWILAERSGRVADLPDPGDFAAERPAWTS